MLAGGRLGGCALAGDEVGTQEGAFGVAGLDTYAVLEGPASCQHDTPPAPHRRSTRSLGQTRLEVLQQALRARDGY
jgi:hypothetical protein